MARISRLLFGGAVLAMVLSALIAAWTAAQAPELYPQPKAGVKPSVLELDVTGAHAVGKLVYMRRLPDGLPSEDDFGVATFPLQAPPPGEVLIKTRLLSVDPYMRGSMFGGGFELPPVQEAQQLLERVPGGENVGEVVESQVQDLPVGTLVRGRWSWVDTVVLSATAVEKLRPYHAPPSTSLGVVGMVGRTAYYGVFEVLRPQAGEVLFVTGAAGATGAIVGQLAKLAGARVYGSAGSDEKVRHLLELGFDGAFNYRAEDPWDAVQRLMPDGIDMFFENTGGPVSEAVVSHLRDGARIAVCGVIHWYNHRSDVRWWARWAGRMRAMLPSSMAVVIASLGRPSSIPRALATKYVAHLALPDANANAWKCTHDVQLNPWGARFTYEGFLVNCYDGEGHLAKTEAQLGAYVQEGKLKYREDKLQGTVADVPRAFVRMLVGQNKGKQLVELADDAGSER